MNMLDQELQEDQRCHAALDEILAVGFGAPAW